MNLQRLNELYFNQATLSNADVEDLRQLTKDYPYYSKPFEILARHYHQTQHYKFNDMLRQAAIRVRDRKALYEFIHLSQVIQSHVSIAATETIVSPQEVLQESAKTTEAPIETAPIEQVETIVVEQSPKAFLEEDILPKEEAVSSIIDHPETVIEPVDAFEAEDLQAFEFEANFDISVIDVQTNSEDADLIGEEIAAEFTFSKSMFDAGDAVQTTENIETTTNVELETNLESPAETGTVTPLETSEAPLTELSKPIQLAETLRKYPVYNIDEFLKETPSEPIVQTELTSNPVTQAPAGAMDFLAWLNSDFANSASSTTGAIEYPIDDELTTPDDDLTETRSVKSLDIIEKFIAINPQISRPKKEFYSPENMAKRSEVVDLEIVSETLANMYYEQGNLDLAIKTYEKLSLQNPAKQPLFVDLIEKIKKEKR